MSHVVHHGSPVAPRTLSRTIGILLAALLLAGGIAVTLVLAIGDDDTSAPIPTPPVTSVARPDEGASAVPPASAYRARPDEGAAAVAVPPASAYRARPDEGAATRAVGVIARHQPYRFYGHR